MADLEKLIDFLNAERLQQSRTIARQPELLGRQNRALEQMRLSRRPSKAPPDERAIAGRVAAACERLERAGTTLSTTQLAGIVSLALNHISGDVRVRTRRRRSLPPPDRAPRLRSNFSDGEEPEGGLDIELLYFSGRQLSPCIEPESTPMSPRASPLAALAGEYATPRPTCLEFSRGVLAGKWGDLPVTVSGDGISVSAIFPSGYKIPGRVRAEGIEWEGGQFWRRLGLGGKWDTGFSEIILNHDGSGIWGDRPISIFREGERISAKFHEFFLEGRIVKNNHLQWFNGQNWFRK